VQLLSLAGGIDLLNFNSGSNDGSAGIAGLICVVSLVCDHSSGSQVNPEQLQIAYTSLGRGTDI
jgi:hypothetical protein